MSNDTRFAARMNAQMIELPAGQLPPSALATAPAAHLSERYRFVDTRLVIRMMAEEGFEVASSSTRRPRRGTLAVDPTRASTGRHLIDFRHPDAPSRNGVVPRVLFSNSHDGSGAAKVAVGAFRVICSNGLVAGEVLTSASARHSGDAARELVERMRDLSRNTLPMFQQIDRWSRVQLAPARAQEFARLAAQLRWHRADAVSVEQLLKVRRPGDDAGDLWTVFNRVQEATTRIEHDTVSASGRRIRTRALHELGPTLRFNSELWALAEEFAS